MVKAHDDLYKQLLQLKGGEKNLSRIAKQRNKASKDVHQGIVKDGVVPPTPSQYRIHGKDILKH